MEKAEYAIFLGDCLEKMPQLQDKSIDLILCDLPYGITHDPHDVRIPFDLLWEQYRRIIKDNGAVLLFGQGLFFADVINSNRDWFRYDLVWNKVLTTGFLNAKKMPLRQHEQIAVFYKNLPTYNPQFTLGEPLHGRGSSWRDKKPNDHNYGKYAFSSDSRKGTTEKYPTSIITISKPHSSVSQHRTEKPVELLKWLIRTYTNENDIVLDNCMGAGGTGVAAIELGRRFVGIEIDEIEFEKAKKRIEETKMSLL